MRATVPPRLPTRLLLGLVLATTLSACQAILPRGDNTGAEPVVAPVTYLLEPVAVPRIARRELPPPAPDLWADMRASFQLDHGLSQRRVQQELAWLKRNPQYLPRLKSRLQRYLPYIHGEVTARGLPGELALLPIVESALDPYAFSHGGAAGLWQFIPATASHFGLPRNWWVDGRRDPVLATGAALDYLEHLHDRFDDWYLAVAGYNTGEGNVRKALRRADGSRVFWDLDLPRETSVYVPRLLALSAVVAQPERYGMSLPELLPEPAFITIDTHGQFDLMKAASALELSLDALYEWNPALNQWSTPPQGPHQLHVPSYLGEVAQARISGIPEDQRVLWSRVEVRPGDTLSHIARRHGTDLATLRRANRLSSDRIRAGQALLIPRSSEARAVYPSAARTPSGNYRVQPGDSLWSIARAHGVPLNKLIRTNHIGPKEVLRVGQRLTIPGGAVGSAAGPGGSGRDVIRKVHYGVRSGDSLSRIAGKFNVGVRDLAKWNQLDVDKYLQPGQKLLIYVNVVAGE